MALRNSRIVMLQLITFLLISLLGILLWYSFLEKILYSVFQQMKKITLLSGILFLIGYSDAEVFERLLFSLVFSFIFQEISVKMFELNGTISQTTMAMDHSE